MTSPNTITPTTTGGPPPNLSLPKLLRWAVKNPPADPTISFTNKIVLVTGANTGLGYEAALKYAKLGAERLILGVRSLERGEAARQRILAACPGRDASSISVMEIDQSDFASVQDFVKKLERAVPRLDVALLNAGIANPKYVKSSEGWEMAVQVNVLSTALLAVLLLPLLRNPQEQSGSLAHLTFVNSIAHTMVKPAWYEPGTSLLAAANDEKTWANDKSYSLVKLLGMSAMKALTRGGRAQEVVVNAVCPSVCKTELGRGFGWGMRVLMKHIPAHKTIDDQDLMLISMSSVPQQMFLARTAEEGARTLVSGTALGVEGHGEFWTHDVLYPVGDLAKDEELMEKTWDEIMEVLMKARSDLPQILNERI